MAVGARGVSRGRSSPSKDLGLDVRLPTAPGATTRGWQAKRFTSGINWGQCQESARRAIAFWRPLRITFAFPKVLSGREQQDFKRFLIDEFPLLKVDWWDASELQTRMRDSEGGRRAAHWLFTHPDADKEELRRALALNGELSDAGHAAVRVASERYPGAADDAGLGGKLIFSDDDEGRRARAAFEQVTREGGTVEIASGMAADFGPVPVGLRGLMPEEPVSGSFEISVVERKRQRHIAAIPVLVRAGDAQIGLALGATDPPEGWTRAAAGSAGGLEIVMAMRGTDVPTESRFEWRWRRGEGTAAEQLLAAEVMRAAYRGADVLLVNPSDESVVVTAAMDRPDDADEQLRELESICAFLEYVVEVESALGIPLEPPAQPEAADLKILSELLGRVRRPTSTGTGLRAELVLSRPPTEGGGPFAVVVLQPLYGTLFGAKRYLGLERIHLPEGRIENFRGDEAEGDTVVIVPAGPSGTAHIEYHTPVEAPEELATRGTSE